jgi:hypothetical protein
MNSTGLTEETPLKKLRCPDCGTKADFPSTFTPKDAASCCEVCRFHLNHELNYDFRCPMCIARLWYSRLQAVRILFLHCAVLRSEEMR